MRVLGLDIGGANIKAATSDGGSVCLPFEIWRKKDLLKDSLSSLVMKLPGLETPPDIVALVMTAELADCFSTKAEGVEFVIRIVQSAFPDSLVRVWLTSGEFAEPDDAVEIPSFVAASNWHALATWTGRAIPSGPALLIDVGSTTTDLIPLLDGVPAPRGLTDLQRLASKELLYTGVRRTPVCAIVSEVPLMNPDADLPGSESVRIPLAAELFATALDVHLLNGDISEAVSELDTADGRPATRLHARNRLAHMLCCDVTELTENQLAAIARFVAERQADQIRSAVQEQLRYLKDLTRELSDSRPKVFLSGSGAWLAERVLDDLGTSEISSVSSLSGMFIRNVSACAPAFAVARLAAERCPDDLLPISPF